MFQAKSEMQNLSPSRTTCASLLRELQSIWDEIGENDGERDKMLLQLEQECLDIYRRKVEKTRKCRADLHQQLADAKAEITSLVSALGELPSFSRERGTLKEQISSYERILEDLRSKKQERVEIFLEIQSQIVSIRAEIVGNGQPKSCPEPEVDERDLTVKRLGELKSHLQDLQNKKVLRLQKVNSYISSIQELAGVMSNDFMKTVNEIHPSLGDFSSGRSKSVSNDTIAQLTGVIHSLNQEKKQRLQKLQDLGGRLVELWNLMDTQNDERKRFDHVTSLMSSPIDEVSGPGCLALDVIDLAKTEVDRLNVLKVSKMKELVLKKQNELEEIYQQSHMDIDNDAARRILSNLIDSGNIDPSDMLNRMDDQITKANEQALSRKDILEKMEKWQFVFQEEKWLDDYEKDENRYSAGRGVHKNLKRAEKARILVSKAPPMVENLINKVKAWELEKGTPFLYDKVPLLHILEEYTKLRKEREEERRKSREQKKLQEQHVAEQEAMFGSRSVPRKPLGQSINANTMVGTPGRRVVTPGHHGVSAKKECRESGKLNNATPANYVALPKDD